MKKLKSLLSPLYLLIFLSIPETYAQFQFDYFVDIQRFDNETRNDWTHVGNAILGYEKITSSNKLKISILGIHGEGPGLEIGTTQSPSNIDNSAIETIRFYELYYEARLKYFDFLIGKFDLASEFNINEPASFFIHSSPGTSSEFAGSGIVGAPVYPSSSLSIRLSKVFLNNFQIRLALSDAVAFSPNDPQGPQIELREDDGLILTSEITFNKNDFYIGLGHWKYTKLKDEGFYFMSDYKFKNQIHPFIHSSATEKRSASKDLSIRTSY